MTDTEKLAAIETVIRDLVALRAHLEREGRVSSFQQANAFAMEKVAEIVGISIA